MVISKSQKWLYLELISLAAQTVFSTELSSTDKKLTPRSDNGLIIERLNIEGVYLEQVQEVTFSTWQCTLTAILAKFPAFSLLQFYFTLYLFYLAPYLLTPP